jgi:hypothetical protein
MPLNLQHMVIKVKLPLFIEASLNLIILRIE